MDFGARDSATVGGLVACDAGGIRAVRHGTVRARVAGLEAVLADGSIVRRMSGLLKDNAGYDLPALLVGSEGTLGVITAVRWRLVARTDSPVAALVPLASIGDAVALMAAVRPLPSLAACELMTREGVELTCRHLGIPPPVDAPASVLLEVGSVDDLVALDVDDAIVADDTAGRERLWRVRDAHTEAISAAGIPHKLDVGVPLDRLAAFADAVRGVVPAGARSILFGHLGDGNVHVNVLGPDPADESVDEAVLTLAAEHGGTISAEHGVGVAKARWLALTRSDAEIAAMRAVKTALDPAWLLNPGAVLPASHDAMASYAVNQQAVKHARRSIESRQYVLNSDWGDSQPAAADENAFLESHSWDEYADWHLGLTEGARDETKARYGFVYGDFRRLHRTGLIACHYRAAEWRHKEVELAAHELLQLLDERSG